MISLSWWSRCAALILVALGVSACAVFDGIGVLSTRSSREGQQDMAASLKQVAEMSIEEYNPTSVIKAVNALRPLGKEAALKQIEEYIKANEGKGDHIGLFWVLRTLFDVPSGRTFPPVQLGAPTIPPPSSGTFPRFPIVIVKDVPLLVIDGYSLDGLPESVQTHIDYFRANGTLRHSDLEPGASSAALTDEVLKQWKQAYGDQYTSQVTATLKAQLARMSK